MPKPVLGSQIIQDTFEKLQDQAQDVAQGFRPRDDGPLAQKDLVTGGNDQRSDSGIEQLLGQPDPKQAVQPAPSQGLDPQRMTQRKSEEQKTAQFHRDQVKKWGEDYKRMQEEETAEKQKKHEEEKKKEEQRIVQLQEEEARAATLNPVKPNTPKGPGAIFAPHQKQTMGTGEIYKRPTN